MQCELIVAGEFDGRWSSARPGEPVTARPLTESVSSGPDRPSQGSKFLRRQSALRAARTGTKNRRTEGTSSCRVA